MQQQYDLSTLERQNGSFIGNKLKQRFNDILYRVQNKQRNASLYTLFEHQSTAEKMLPPRVLHYELDTMQQHLNMGHDALPEVISFVFYRGKRSPYPFSADILDCFEQTGKKRRGDFPKIPTIIDISAIPDEEIRTHGPIALLEILQKYIKVKDLCDFTQDVMLELRRYPLSIERKKRVFHYILSEGDCANFDQFYKMVFQYSSQEGEEIMSVAQQLREEGMQRSAQEIAIKMLQKDLPVKLITEITGLDLKKIHALAKSFKSKPKLAFY